MDYESIIHVYAEVEWTSLSYQPLHGLYYLANKLRLAFECYIYLSNR